MSRMLLSVAAALILGSHAALAQAPTPVTIAWGAYPEVPQIAIATDKNYWKDEGLAVQIVPFATGREGFEAMIGGQIDFAVMAEFPATTGVMRNLKFAVVAVLSKYTKTRAIVKSPTPVTTLQQIAGKKVGVPMGGNLHFISADALKRQGVSVELVNVSPPDLIPALVRGDIAAAFTFPSSYQAAQRTLADQYREIFLPGYGTTYVMAVSDKIATGNPALIRRVLSALLKGEELIARDLTESQEATARFAGKTFPVETIRASWSDNEFKVQIDKATLDFMTRQGVWLREQNFIKEGTATPELFAKYFLTAPLKELAPARVEIE